MIQLLISAPCSASGKTTLTCALLAALKAKGCAPCAFKCGPDYIDPMFHRAVLGVGSHNLDLFFTKPEALRTFYAQHAAGHGAAVCEGAMGFYDGLGGVTAEASAWHTADVLGLPVLLCVRPGGAALTLAAQIKGLAAFRTPGHISGIILNCCSGRLYKTLAPVLEAETGIPVLGYMPQLEQATIASRHLGLYTAAEVEHLQAKLTLLAGTAAKTIDWPRFESVFDMPAPAYAAPEQNTPLHLKIAAARDEAFCFAYAETLETLRAEGAQIVYFSPVHGDALPGGIGGLYLPGGYPELYAKELAANKKMREAIKSAVLAGLPTAAECGGFMYLCRSLEGADGAVYDMAGALPGHCFKVGRLVRFGYARLTAHADSMLLRAGESVPVHEFHHWDSTANGSAFTAQKPVGGQSWLCGYAGSSLYAAFAHLYWAGTPLPRRFVNAAAAFAERTNNERS